MNFICNILNEQRVVELALPDTPTKIAVFVSGGLDSAILYYLILKASIEQGVAHQISPFVVNRTEGSRYFSKLVVAHVHSQFNMPYVDPILVGDPTLPGHLQVLSGAQSAQYMGFTRLYGGIIAQRPEHTIGYEPSPAEETDIIKLPFKDLTKGYIIDLIVRNKQEALFYLTHSCSILEIGKCNTCNGCNERNWGFAQAGLVDPGTI
jgi:hypothetical protein